MTDKCVADEGEGKNSPDQIKEEEIGNLPEKESRIMIVKIHDLRNRMKAWIKMIQESKAFSASMEIIIWFLFFKLLLCHITLIDLRILKNPCIPGIKPTWSLCMIFLMCCWILIARILLRIFASMFFSDIGL